MDSIMVLVPCTTLAHDARYGSLSRDEALRKYREQFDEDFVTRVRETVFTLEDNT